MSSIYLIVFVDGRDVRGQKTSSAESAFFHQLCLRIAKRGTCSLDCPSFRIEGRFAGSLTRQGIECPPERTKVSQEILIWRVNTYLERILLPFGASKVFRMQYSLGGKRSHRPDLNTHGRQE